MIEVYGYAAGRGSTGDVRRGDIARREYASLRDVPIEDWVVIYAAIDTNGVSYKSRDEIEQAKRACA